jgi:hypothetical protein
MKWMGRHKVASGLLAFVALIVIIVAASAGGSKPENSTTAATQPAVTAPAVPVVADSTTPAPTPAAPRTVTYEVTGSDAQVTYGPAGRDLSGTVPMKVTAKLGDPAYYALQAQLQGGGSVTVKILVNGKVVSQGTASGGYNIAMAEISKNPLTGEWESDNG